jgi:hypothetical protein
MIEVFMGIDEIADLSAAGSLQSVVNLIYASDIGVNQHRRVVGSFDNSEVGCPVDSDYSEYRVLELPYVGNTFSHGGASFSTQIANTGMSLMSNGGTQTPIYRATLPQLWQNYRSLSVRIGRNEGPPLPLNA